MTGPPDPPPWRGRFLLYGTGAALVLVGLRGIAHNTHGWENPPYWAGLLVAGAVGHDLLLAPAVFAGAVLLMRTVPHRDRPPVATGLVVSAVLVLVALPGLRGSGRLPDNPTILPLHYGRGLLVSLAVTWGIVGAAALVRAVRGAAGRAGQSFRA